MSSSKKKARIAVRKKLFTSLIKTQKKFRMSLSSLSLWHSSTNISISTPSPKPLTSLRHEMPFISDTASAIKSRFGFHDHSSDPVRSTPGLPNSAAKEAVSAIRSIRDWNDDEDDDGKVSTSAASSNQSFEFREDPSFWKDHNVQVIIRIRPLSSAEISVQGYSKCIRQESCQTITWTGHPESRFTFDIVADENVSQEQLFKVAGLAMVDNCMIGYNSCMFAYGQTGSGKTHTMLGDIEGGTRRHSVNWKMELDYCSSSFAKRIS